MPPTPLRTPFHKPHPQRVHLEVKRFVKSPTKQGINTAYPGEWIQRIDFLCRELRASQVCTARLLLNGDAPAIASASAGTEGSIPPKTAEQKLARKNELKAKITLLLAILDEHLLKFHGIKDAKTLWEAIKARFGGNKESKKMQKTIMKQQYENFAASRSEGLDKTYDRKMKSEVGREKSYLPSAWNNIALIMRNKSDLNTLSINELYKNLKGQSSSSTYADDVMFSFFANQSNSPQLDNEDLKQIDTDDLEEMDLKWQVAMLTMRVKRFLKKIGRNLNFNGKETVGFEKTKVECYNCYRKGHFARECRAPWNQGNRNEDAPRRNAPVDTSTTNALVGQDGIGSSSSLSSDFEVSICSKACLKSYESLKEHFDKQKVQLKKSNLEIIGFKKSEGYHAVPPPFTRNFKPTRADLSFAGLDDSVYKSKVSETITSVPNVETTESDSEDENVFEPKEVKKTVKSSFEKIEFVNARNLTVEKPKKFSQNPIDKKRNRNSFEFTISMFVCGSFKHLIKDCDFHDKKMVQKPVLNNVKRGIGQREVRQVWNNEMRYEISAARQSSSRAATPASVARPINTAAPKPFMNVARPRLNAFHKLHSPSRTPFNQQTTLKNKILKVNTAKGNPQYALQHQGIFDSGCSRHMTGNKFYLSDYQDINGGFELKFNFFSVSQLSDKKNSVLFTETECLVLSPDFKLLDESQVFLKIPRQNNMYSFDMKSVVPSVDLTCRKPALNFMRPFGCLVTILNTLDHLGTRPNWMFDIDTLSMSMNYQPVFAENQTNGNAEYEIADDAGKKNGVEDPAKEADINSPGEATNTNITNRLNTVSSPVNTCCLSSSYENLGGSTFVNATTSYNADYPTDPLMPDWEDTTDLQDTGGGYRATAPGYYQRNNANPSYQERSQSMEDTLSKFMSESTKRHEENSNLIKEIRATTDAAIRTQGASIKTLEIQIGQMSKVLQERGFGSLPNSTKMNPRDQVKSISTTIEVDSHSIRRIRSSQYAVLLGIADLIITKPIKRNDERRNNEDLMCNIRSLLSMILCSVLGDFHKGYHEEAFMIMENGMRVVRKQFSIWIRDVWDQAYILEAALFSQDFMDVICGINSWISHVSTGQNNTLLYKSRQTTVPFPSRLDNHYCEEEEGNYGTKLTKACGASHINNDIPRKEKDPRSFTLPCFINNTCFDNALVDLGASVSVMPLSTYLNLGLGELAHTRLTVELADRTVKYPKGIAENVLVGIGKFTFRVEFIILDMPEDIRVPLILGRPFLSTAHVKIDVYKRKITLRVGEERIVFSSVKPASSLINRVYMLSLRERMELDLDARLIGETLVLNRSLDPFLEDYIELNDLNEPFKLRRNQGDDLMPTIEEGEVIEEFKTRSEDLDIGIDDYPCYYDDDKKIHIDCAHNLKFS
ncbi:ribonuclease H-like domain-containing protein [Tanacetum coccineum]